MSQDRDSGARANAFGHRMATTVAKAIGAQRHNPAGNEFRWKGGTITIRSAHRGTAYICVLYSMLERVGLVLAALETGTADEFEVWMLDQASYSCRARPQVKDGRLAQLPVKMFREKGKLIAEVRDAK